MNLPAANHSSVYHIKVAGLYRPFSSEFGSCIDCLLLYVSDQLYSRLLPPAVKTSWFPNLQATCHNAPGKDWCKHQYLWFLVFFFLFLGYLPLSLSLVIVLCINQTLPWYCTAAAVAFYSSLNKHNEVTENTITRQLRNSSTSLTTSQTLSLLLRCQQNYVWLVQGARYKHWNGSLQLGIATARWGRTVWWGGRTAPQPLLF